MIERIITGDLGVNTYLFNFKENKIVIIDPGSDGDKIIKRVKDKGYSVDGIILTHGHFDHIGAVKILKDQYNTKLYIHKEDAPFLGKQGAEHHRKMFSSMGPGGESYYNLYYTPNDGADFLVTDGEQLDNFGLEVIHTPGHSPGSICLYSKEHKKLFSGDTIFCQGLGRTDFHGGDYNTLIESVKKVLKLPQETQILPGHGSYTSVKDELIRY